MEYWERLESSTRRQVNHTMWRISEAKVLPHYLSLLLSDAISFFNFSRIHDSSRSRDPMKRDRRERFTWSWIVRNMAKIKYKKKPPTFFLLYPNGSTLLSRIHDESWIFFCLALSHSPVRFVSLSNTRQDTRVKIESERERIFIFFVSHRDVTIREHLF